MEAANMHLFFYRPNPETRRAIRVAALIALLVLTMGFPWSLFGQCADHPDKRTAVKFSNESSFELTFFVDEDEDGVIVPAGAVSGETEVPPGEHLLRAKAVVRGQSFFVWTINEVPEGQVCTWTITDPSQRNANRIEISPLTRRKYQ
jgi:hypothetical protein